MQPLLAAAWALWQHLAALAAPWAAAAAALTWAAVICHAWQDASAKAYALEQRVNVLVAAVLPLAGGTVTGDTTFTAVVHGTGGVLQVADTVNGYAAGSAAPETWNDMRPLQNSFIGSISGYYPPQYRRTPDGFVEVAGFVQTPAGATSNYNSLPFYTMPAPYRPAANAGHRWFVSGAADGPATPVVQVDPAGNLQFHFLPSTGLGSTILGIYGRYPLNNPIAS